MLNMDAPWWTVALPLIAALAIVEIPGALVIRALRLRGLSGLALAPVASIGLWAAAGLLTQFTGPFTLPWTMLGLTVAATVGAVFLGRGRRLPAAAGIGRRAAFAIGGAMLLAAIVMAFLSFAGVSSPSQPNQTYDGVFHTNLTLWMLTEGHTSALQALGMVSTTGGGFYPNAWHILAVAIASLTGANVPTTFAALWITVCAVIWLPGIVWATDAIVRPKHRTVVLVITALAASAFTTFPYLLHDFGTLYPTVLAMSMLPSGLAALSIAMRALRVGRGVPIGTHGFPSWEAFLLLAVLWLIAVGLANPLGFVTFAVIAVPCLVAEGISVLRERLRSPRQRRPAIVWASATVLVVIGAGVVGYLVIRRLYPKPLADMLNGGPAHAHFTLWEGLWQLFAIAPPTAPGDIVLPASLALALILLVSAVIVGTRSGLRRLLVAGAAIMVLYLLAATSNDDLAKLLTGIWYKDKFRLISALPIVGIPIIAAAADWVIGRMPVIRRRRSLVAVTSIIAVLVLLATWFGPAQAGLIEQTALEYDASGSSRDGISIDGDDVAVLRDAASIIPPGEQLLGDPWQGAILSWSIAGIRPAIAHYTPPQDPDLAVLAAQLDGLGPEVCAALARLDLHYAFFDDDPGAMRDESREYFPGLAAAGSSKLGPVVAAEGSARLVEITACG